jgi:hypothetical protein
VPVRLVRLAQQPSRVAEDIRAALASLGRGGTVVGGVALVGARPRPPGHAVDAIVVLPRAVLIVLGVDLPEPALRLEAPLTGPWKADGWALASSVKAVNPASDKLVLAELITRALRPKVPEHLPIGTVLAVGPFVEEVDQPPVDVAGGVRVLYPTANAMLAAVVSLGSAPDPCSVEEARALIKALAPDASGITEEMLSGEGFGATGTAPEKAGTTAKAAGAAGEDLLTAITVTMPRIRAAAPVPPPPPKPIEITVPVPRTTAAAPVHRPVRAAAARRVRWVPFAALGLLAVLIVTAIVLATTGGGSGSMEAQAPAPPQIVEGIPLLQRAAGGDTRCAVHAVGDLQASLQRTGCVTMERGSFEATVDGKPAAVSITEITFADAATAVAFKKVADNPGGGEVTDLAAETGKWPRAPRFDGAAYISAGSGTTVRLALAAWFDQPSTATDPALLRAARAGLTARLP